jgi:cell division protein FtsZ
MSEFEEINNYIQEESGFTAEMIIGTSYDETLGENISVTLIATGFDALPKENKIIVGNVSTNTQYVPPVMEKKAPSVQPVMPKSIMPEPTKYSLEEERFEPKKPEPNPNEIELNLRIEEEIVEDSFELPADFFNHAASVDLPINELPLSEMVANDLPANEVPLMPEFSASAPIFDAMNDTSLEDQEKKIEKHIQRIRTLKDLNLTLNSPQGLRDLEKEPAYKRKLKRLDDVPHSSATQVSRLSLFDDNSGKPEIKTNNSFLHDNVD